ncbi:MAG TPA: iron-sulfur cluster repair di-iron protein [Bacteroidales bacterium]|nr:iron-sulfur cluster repair di-iron protein [Bacteroidales bacterium]
MEKFKNVQVGEIVTRDFRAAEIFKNVGIDFCCGGAQSLEEACKEKNLDLSDLELELQSLQELPTNDAHRFNDFKLDFLCDYIENTHHKTVLRLLPQLVAYTQKIANVHGAHHAELVEIAALFLQINTELLQHLKNEEEVLFPAIKEVLRSNSAEAKAVVLSEITRMKGEHEFAGGAMDKINVLSKNYSVPADGCNTYDVTYKLLEQFEDDLHVHVHLENNILYPKALKL